MSMLCERCKLAVERVEADNVDSYFCDDGLLHVWVEREDSGREQA